MRTVKIRIDRVPSLTTTVSLVRIAQYFNELKT